MPVVYIADTRNISSSFFTTVVEKERNEKQAKKEKLN